MLKRKELVDWFKANRRWKLDFESTERTEFIDATFSNVLLPGRAIITPTKLTLSFIEFQISYTLDSLRVKNDNIVNGLDSLCLYCTPIDVIDSIPLNTTGKLFVVSRGKE